MIWLYLMFLLVGVAGLFVVFLEWTHGVRHGLLGPFSTFGVILLISTLGLLWLHSIDGLDKRCDFVAHSGVKVSEPGGIEPPPKMTAPPTGDPPDPWRWNPTALELTKGTLASFLGGLLLNGVWGIRKLFSRN